MFQLFRRQDPPQAALGDASYLPMYEYHSLAQRRNGCLGLACKRQSMAFDNMPLQSQRHGDIGQLHLPLPIYSTARKAEGKADLQCRQHQMRHQGLLVDMIDTE